MLTVPVPSILGNTLVTDFTASVRPACSPIHSILVKKVVPSNVVPESAANNFVELVPHIRSVSTAGLNSCCAQGNVTVDHVVVPADHEFASAGFTKPLAM